MPNINRSASSTSYYLVIVQSASFFWKTTLTASWSWSYCPNKALKVPDICARSFTTWVYPIMWSSSLFEDTFKRPLLKSPEMIFPVKSPAYNYSNILWNLTNDMPNFNMSIANMKTRNMKLSFLKVIIDIPLTSNLLKFFVNPVTLLESCPILFSYFANDYKFKTNIFEILSKTTFISIVKNKQWSFSSSYSFSSRRLTLIEYLLYSPCKITYHNFLFY